MTSLGAVPHAEIFGTLIPGGKGYIAMLTAYLDASGITRPDKHIVLAGFVGPTDKWERFEQEWADLLAAPKYAAKLPVKNGKRYAHAKKLAQWPDLLRETFYLEANYLLRRVADFGVAATFEHADYDYAFENYPHTVKDSRYGLVFRCALTGCCKNINANYGAKPLAFVLEHGDPNQGGAEAIFNRTADANAALRRAMAEAHLQYNVTTFTVGFKEQWGALQAADMHAYTLLKHLLSGKGVGSGRYVGDINYLLQYMQVNHFKPRRQDIRRMRDSMEWAIAKPKLWGAAKRLAASGGAQ